MPTPPPPSRVAPAQAAGFSLLEVLVAIAVVGIIAAALVPRLVGHTDAARQRTCESNRRTLNVLLEHYAWEIGDYANDLQQLDLSGYFPDGIPSCPVTGATYNVDQGTHRVKEFAPSPGAAQSGQPFCTAGCQ